MRCVIVAAPPTVLVVRAFVSKSVVLAIRVRNWICSFLPYEREQDEREKKIELHFVTTSMIHIRHSKKKKIEGKERRLLCFWVFFSWWKIHTVRPSTCARCSTSVLWWRREEKRAAFIFGMPNSCLNYASQMRTDIMCSGTFVRWERKIWHARS